MKKENNIQFPRYRVYEDPVFFLKVMCVCKRFYVIPQKVYTYSGPHEINLDPVKAIDYLHGLADNLRLSSAKGYADLHYLVFKRLISSGCYYAEKNMDTSEKRIFHALMSANEAIDISLLDKIGIHLGEDYMIPPLINIWNMRNRYYRLRSIPVISLGLKLIKKISSKREEVI